MPKVLAKIKEEPVEIIMVVPWWPKKSLVTQPSGIEHGIAKGSSIAPETAIAAANPHIPSESAAGPASHLEAIAEGVVE